MLQTQTNTNIVSTPNLITLDNEEAKIIVGSNVPFITGQFTNTGVATTSPFQTIERKDVGITLRIRPQVGEGGAVRMTIFQEASALSDKVAPGTSNAGPSTDKRSIESTVVVDDGAILVLGGLIEGRSSTRASSQGAAARRHPVPRRAVSQREPHQDTHQPDGLPAPGGDARHRELPTSCRSTATTSSAPASRRRSRCRARSCEQRARRWCRRRPWVRRWRRSNTATPPAHPAARRRRPRPTDQAAAQHGFATPAALRLCQGQHAAAGGRRRAACAVGGRQLQRQRAVRGGAAVRRHQLRARSRRHAGPAHRRRLRRRRVERGRGGGRGRKRGRPEPPDARAAGGRRPARSRRRRADHPHAQRAADAGRQGRRQRHPHRALRALERGALSRRRHAARGGAAQQGAARGADLAAEDHGRARHRREAPAAGRPHLAAHRRPRGRRARVHAAGRARRARRAAPARQDRRQLLARGPGHEPDADEALRAHDRAAARHRAGHRAHRLGQDHHAVRVAGAAADLAPPTS